MKTINNKNHINLKSNVIFSELPIWFKEANTMDAIIIYENNYLTWKNGIWIDGVWIDGVWQNGVWQNGVWENGVWENGVWQNGTWIDGLWKNGTWIDGLWKNGTWIDGFSNPLRCKWKILINNDIIKIGCKLKTIEEWKLWFENSNETYETDRDTEQFELIRKSFYKAIN